MKASQRRRFHKSITELRARVDSLTTQVEELEELVTKYDDLRRELEAAEDMLENYHVEYEFAREPLIEKQRRRLIKLYKMADEMDEREAAICSDPMCGCPEDFRSGQPNKHWVEFNWLARKYTEAKAPW